MKSTKNILCIVGFAALLVVQVVYLMTVYKDDKAYIEANKEEIKMTQRRLSQLEARVSQLPETKKELELVTSEKMALLNMIPTFKSGSKEGIELMRYMNMNDFMSTGFKVTETEEILNSSESNESSEETTNYLDDTIVKRSYELTFVGRYNEVQSFVDNLNRSYQIINIESLALDNSVQKLDDEDNLAYYLYYGDDFNNIVKATIQLSMFTRRDDNEEDREIYQPDLNMRTNLENIFSLVQESDQEVSPSISQEEKELPVSKEPADVSKDLFTLLVGDILTSGDTYKFDGPGEESSGYVGLISETNVEMNLVIRKDGYDVTIKDAEGQEETTSISTAIEKPEMSIISTMRPISEVMPSVHIYVDNQTSQEMIISLKGSLTNNIRVYNSAGEQVSKGQSKENIRLT